MTLDRCKSAGAEEFRQKLIAFKNRRAQFSAAVIAATPKKRGRGRPPKVITMEDLEKDLAPGGIVLPDDEDDFSIAKDLFDEEN